jgi:hypothetical protein
MTKKATNAIPENEIRLAAIFFAIGNMALDSVFQDSQNKDRSGLIDLNRCEQGADMMLADIDGSIKNEVKDWEKTIRKGDSYCNKEWLEQRHKFVLPV